MHLNPNEAFVWLYILNIYGGLFGAKMFFIFWHSKQRSSVINTAFWAPPAEIQSFHVNRCLRKFLEGFTLNQLSDWELSEHAVKFARDLQTCLSSFHSHRHTFTHIDSPSKSKSESCETEVSFLKVKKITRHNWTEQKGTQDRQWTNNKHKSSSPSWAWNTSAVFFFYFYFNF